MAAETGAAGREAAGADRFGGRRLVGCIAPRCTSDMLPGPLESVGGGMEGTVVVAAIGKAGSVAGATEDGVGAPAMGAAPPNHAGGGLAAEDCWVVEGVVDGSPVEGGSTGKPAPAKTT